MKKIFASVMCLVLLVGAGLQTSVSAQDRYSRRDARANYGRRYEDNRRDYYEYDRRNGRSVWDQHRDKITTVAGALGGAALGGIVGGKKGALIGAIAGGAGSAIYTYKIRNKDRRYRY